MKPIIHFGIRTLGLTGFAWLALSAAAVAQVSDQMGTFVPAPRNHQFQQSPDGEQRHPTYAQSQQPPYVRGQQKPPAAAPPPAQPQAVTQYTATPPSLLDKPARPAKIDLEQGQLSIHADNSSLIDIMRRLTADAGMTVDGLSKDQRVFGTYGPGDPQEVISELLDGTGYNVVMLGRTDAGTPKQLTLTPRAGGVPSAAAPMRPELINQEEDADDDPPQQPLISNPVEPPQPLAPQQPGGGVRTPQQMMQELQQMRQQQMLQMQQQQQNQPQPPPPPQQQ